MTPLTPSEYLISFQSKLGSYPQTHESNEESDPEEIAAQTTTTTTTTTSSIQEPTSSESEEELSPLQSPGNLHESSSSDQDSVGELQITLQEAILRFESLLTLSIDPTLSVEDRIAAI